MPKPAQLPMFRGLLSICQKTAPRSFLMAKPRGGNTAQRRGMSRNCAPKGSASKKVAAGCQRRFVRSGPTGMARWWGCMRNMMRCPRTVRRQGLNAPRVMVWDLQQAGIPILIAHLGCRALAGCWRPRRRWKNTGLKAGCGSPANRLKKSVAPSLFTPPRDTMTGWRGCCRSIRFICYRCAIPCAGTRIVARLIR